ncbi:MAG TPA: hypothetical protein VHE78_07675 [Gemmatimonadaceae bacterium]|nr:hypothetical protein [Gemmatimonadaceae bacterium]
MDAMADLSESAQFLGAEMQQVAVVRPLVALHGPRRIERGERVEPQSPLFADDAGHRQSEIARDAERAPPPMPARLDLAAVYAVQPARAALRTRGPIGQTGRSFAPIAPDPFPQGLPRDVIGASHCALIRPGTNRAAHDLRSHNGRESCMLVRVHRSSGGGRVSVQTTPAWCCYDL